MVNETQIVSFRDSQLLNEVCKKEIKDRFKVGSSVVRKADEYHLPEIFIIKEFGDYYLQTDSGKFSYSTFYYFSNGKFVSDKELNDFISYVKAEYRNKRIDDII
jgi:hypothetical protein